MQNAQVGIKGLTPYYFNKYLKAATGKGDKAEKELAKKKVYCNGDGLYFPGIQVQGCIIGGIRFMKMKLEKSMTRAIEYVQAGLRSEPYDIQFLPKMEMDDIELLKEITRVDLTKVRENWYGRIAKEWNAEFELVFPDFLPAPFVKEALETGGAYCGIGGRRNWKRGRFELMRFEVV
jgi:hypothetical protein